MSDISNPPKGDTSTNPLREIHFKLRRELDKWDRTELELTNGESADFMAIDTVLEKLTPVVMELLTAKTTEARLHGQLEALSSFHNQGVISGLSYTESVKQIYRQLEQFQRPDTTAVGNDLPKYDPVADIVATSRRNSKLKEEL